ncbi:MAG: cytochrome c family protein [Rhodospirillales bacterium]|nr:cytochrome c family protein [Rhodospirillales bacterium]MBO6787903.1 cytochrome c family protein [Rhodospirillales bacterium]
MHFSFWEKTGFALLMAAWVVWGSNQIGNMLVHADELSEDAYKIEVAESGGGAAASAEQAPEESAMDLLASATTDRGEKVFKKCAGCHTIEKGGADKVGPHLWGVMGRALGGVSGFAYSDALAAKGGEWTFEDMDAFLKSPRDFVPGTKMTFAGLKKASDRAAVLLYLRENHDNPPPLP